ANSPYSPVMIYLAYAVSAGFFTVLFGGTWLDALYSIPIALVIRLVKVWLNRFNENKMVDNIILSAILTFMALLGPRFFPQLNSDMIIIGDIMLLIPGLAFCNSIHDMVMGDTISGVLSMFDAVLRALSIAIGYAAVWAVIERFL
ncbi:MAG: threonine/serine exporter family protein, partial [Anaerolineaceae bacterium]|nr:threonine/serine exporter family protein [Anaerolineaceae bacterium]